MVKPVAQADPVLASGIRSRCARSLSGFQRQSPAQVLAELQQEVALGGDGDRYGAGGVVTEVEGQVRDLLGAEAAVLLPTGTMAQQVALQLHCSARGRRRVALHPTSPLLLWEEDALHELSGMESVEPSWDLGGLAAVVVELPRRETGGQLVSFDKLVALSFRCTDAGVALHLDGARLWECGPAYAPRSLGEVVALADTTYVSLYKGLGGLGGAVLCCRYDQVEQVRTWRHRYGGTMPALWPLALSARRGLREWLPRIPVYVEAARALAREIEVVSPPVTPLLHVVLQGEPGRLLEALLAVAEESGTWLAGAVGAGPRPGTGVIEISYDEGALAVATAELAGLLRRVCELAAR